jgi:hypothetical protein
VAPSAADDRELPPVAATIRTDCFKAGKEAGATVRDAVVDERLTADGAGDLTEIEIALVGREIACTTMRDLSPAWAEDFWANLSAVERLSEGLEV